MLKLLRSLGSRLPTVPGSRLPRAVTGALTLLLAGQAALFAGCSDAPPEPEPFLERLALAPAAPASGSASESTAGAIALARRIDVPASLEGWTVEAGSADVRRIRSERSGDPERALVIDGNGQTRIDIAGPFEPQTFNQVAVVLDTTQEIELAVTLTVGDNVLRPPLRSRLVQPGRDYQVLVFDFPNTRALRQDLSQVTIATQRDHGVWRLLRVDLLQRPLENFLPLGDELIEFSNEARRGRGLLSTTPLAAELAVPSGAELTFAYAWPPELRTPGANARLVVSVGGAAPDGAGDKDGAGGKNDGDATGRPSTVLGRYPLLRPAVDGVGWHTERVALEAYAGRRVRIVFSIESESDAPVLCALTEPCVAAASPASPARTILLITSDTHRADHVAGAPRAARVATPALAALRARGVAFDDCFATINNTIPSHVALLTATHPRDTGILTNRASLSPDAPTLAEHFRAAGWVTYAVTSMGNLGHPSTGLGQGFDRLSWPRGGQRNADDSLAVLERWLPDAEGRPLFVWLHLYDAHHPYAPPPAFAKAYYPADRDPADPALPERDFPAPYRYHQVRDPEWFEAMYKGEITYLDRRLGTLLDRPRFRDGIVAFTADHGESLGENGIYWDHTGLYPSVVAVPLILAWPGAPAGTSVAAPVLQTDVGRTLLDLAGMEAIPFDGRSLLPAIEGAVTELPRFALGAQAACASLSVGGWHAVLHLERSPRSQYVPDDHFPRHQFELYDLARDPDCANDLAAAEPERARKLRQALVEWLNGVVPTGWMRAGPDNPEMVAALAELGYVTDVAPTGGRSYIEPDCACDKCEAYR